MERFAGLNLPGKLIISSALSSLWLLMPTAAEAQTRLPVPKPPAIRSPQAVPPPPINISVPQIQAQDEPDEEEEPSEPAEPDEEKEPSEPAEPSGDDEGG